MLFIDTREGSKNLPNYEPIKSSIPYDLCQLNSGDIAFCANGPNEEPILIGIEIKSIEDLITSLHSKRLNGMDGQLQRMTNDYPFNYRWLLIYGRYRPSPETLFNQQNEPYNPIQIYKESSPPTNRRNYPRKAGWYGYTIGKQIIPYGYVESFLSGPMLSAIGFNVKRVESIEEAAKWIGILYRTWTKPYNSHKSLKCINESNQQTDSKIKSEQKQLFYAGIPTIDVDDTFKLMVRFFNIFDGMGYERSVAAARNFDSIWDIVVNGDIDRLSNVEIESSGKTKRTIKLGSVISKSLFDAIRRKKG